MGVTTVDYLVIGSGLTGSTIARRLADAGRDVLVLERRAEIGGNVRDSLHHAGVRVGTYGPHYFRCSSPRIWEFVNRFAEFQPFHARVMALVNGTYESWPINSQHVRRYADWRPPSNQLPPRNFEEACLRKVPLQIYRTMIEGYTRKQWGVDPKTLGPDLARRIRVNPPGEYSLTPHRHQALPVGGYAGWMEAMLDGIPRRCGVDFLQRRDEFRARKLLVSTGSVDEFFGFDEGRLGYRSQRRTDSYFSDRDLIQPCVQVNHPNGDSEEPIRTIEWKHLLSPGRRPLVTGTVITDERPYSPSDPDAFEYPFPDRANNALYRRYRARADRIPKLLVCGRLGDYRYYDMDHAIARALMIADRIVGASRAVTLGSRPLMPA
jgi:UDP-galactopyranose mutase